MGKGCVRDEKFSRMGFFPFLGGGGDWRVWWLMGMGMRCCFWGEG